MDVGHGDCTIIQLPDGKTAIIDGGEVGVSKKILQKYIAKRIGGRRAYFDYVINTHPHSDHLSGLVWLMQNYRYGTFINYQNFDDYTVIAGVGYRIMLHALNQSIPVGADVDEDQNANEISPIITIETGAGVGAGSAGAVFVVTGDAGFSTELDFYQNSDTAREIFDGTKHDGRTVFLQIGHHGSQHSTGTNFLEFIRPDYAIIPMSATNNYGHPHKTVTDKLDFYGVKTLRTSDVGSIAWVDANTKNRGAVGVAGGGAMYIGFDNPPNLAPFWVLVLFLTVVLCFMDYHYILWSKKF